MPIFEYSCQSCGHRFEHLTRADREAACPACDGKALSKHLSTFAVGANGTGSRTGVRAAEAWSPLRAAPAARAAIRAGPEPAR